MLFRSHPPAGLFDAERRSGWEQMGELARSLGVEEETLANAIQRAAAGAVSALAAEVAASQAAEGARSDVSRGSLFLRQEGASAHSVILGPDADRAVVLYRTQSGGYDFVFYTIDGKELARAPGERTVGHWGGLLEAGRFLAIRREDRFLGIYDFDG